MGVRLVSRQETLSVPVLIKIPDSKPLSCSCSSGSPTSDFKCRGVGSRFLAPPDLLLLVGCQWLCTQTTCSSVWWRKPLRGEQTLGIMGRPGEGIPCVRHASWADCWLVQDIQYQCGCAREQNVDWSDSARDRPGDTLHSGTGTWIASSDWVEGGLPIFLQGPWLGDFIKGSLYCSIYRPEEAFTAQLPAQFLPENARVAELISRPVYWSTLHYYPQHQEHGIHLLHLLLLLLLLLILLFHHIPHTICLRDVGYSSRPADWS